jgi:hypothetical protein
MNSRNRLIGAVHKVAATTRLTVAAMASEKTHTEALTYVPA